MAEAANRHPDCDECRAILDDFLNSLGEVDKFKDELRNNADAIQRQLAEEGGADLEEFALRTRDFASRFDNPRCPGFARAMQRMLAHYQRSGHYTSVRALLT